MGSRRGARSERAEDGAGRARGDGAPATSRDVGAGAGAGPAGCPLVRVGLRRGVALRAPGAARARGWHLRGLEQGLGVRYYRPCADPD